MVNKAIRFVVVPGFQCIRIEQGGRLLSIEDSLEDAERKYPDGRVGGDERKPQEVR